MLLFVMEALSTETIDAVISIVPSFNEDSELKRSYIGWRLCGFNPAESLLYSGVSASTFRVWSTDPEFVHINSPAVILSLSEKAGEHLINEQMMRNHRLALKTDGDILGKAAILGVSALTDREAKLYERIRPMYSPRVIGVLGLGENEPPPGSWQEALKTIADLGESTNTLAHVVEGVLNASKKEENKQEKEIILEIEYQESSSKSLGSGLQTEQSGEA